jgi:hypothetical protein
MMTAGIVVGAMGIGAFAVGLGLILAYADKWLSYSAETFGCGGPSDCPDELTLKPHPDLAYGALASGLAGLALVGTAAPLIVSGARRAPAPSTAWWIPRPVAVGRQGLQLTFGTTW